MGRADLRVDCRCVMNPSSSIRRSTYSCRALRRGGVVHRREPHRRLDHARERRRLAEGEVLHALAEVEAARLLDAVAEVAEVDLVQVQEEDLVLREVLLEARREDELLHLALHAPVALEQERLHHLLGDGRAAALHAADEEPLHDAARDGEVVHALVLVEVGVLGREHRLPEHQRDLLERARRCAARARSWKTSLPSAP